MWQYMKTRVYNKKVNYFIYLKEIVVTPVVTAHSEIASHHLDPERSDVHSDKSRAYNNSLTRHACKLLPHFLHISGFNKFL
jgi:hypothetical protein